MAELLLDTQGTGITPASGKTLVYPDSSSKQVTSLDDTGRKLSLGGIITNWNTVDVVANAADTYLTGSMLTVPQHLLQVGTTLRWKIWMTKTAAGVASPVWSLRVGIAGTTADTVRCTFTGGAQTAVVDTGYVEIVAVVRNIGAAGVLAGGLALAHNLASTGFALTANTVLQSTSAGFDTTAAGLKIGISVNPGASAIWTHQVVTADVLGM